jgi:hypothetical protein
MVMRGPLGPYRRLAQSIDQAQIVERGRAQA